MTPAEAAITGTMAFFGEDRVPLLSSYLSSNPAAKKKTARNRSEMMCPTVIFIPIGPRFSVEAIRSRRGPPKGEFAKTNPSIAAVIMIMAALRSDFIVQKYLIYETRCSSQIDLRNILEIQ